MAPLNIHHEMGYLLPSPRLPFRTHLLRGDPDVGVQQNLHVRHGQLVGRGLEVFPADHLTPLRHRPRARRGTGSRGGR